MKFDDIKVGDAVMIREISGIFGYGRHPIIYFKKDFFLELIVSKVTKTQFTANGLRFTKDGRGFGDNNAVAYNKGEEFNGLFKSDTFKVPYESEELIMQEYENKLKPLRKYSVVIGKDEISPLKATNLEDALVVDGLLMQAKKLIGMENK